MILWAEQKAASLAYYSLLGRSLVKAMVQCSSRVDKKGECWEILIPMVYCSASRLVVWRWMVPQMASLKALLISKAFHYPAMLASMMLWVGWMGSNLVWSFQ